MRITVSPDKAKVEYVRSFLSKDETDQHKNREIEDPYEIEAKP